MDTIITTLMNQEPASHHHGNIRFPLLLYSVLQDAENDPELADIISWEPSGTSFKIHDQKSCAENVLPHYFPKMKSYRSLRRQLNLYGILIHNHPNEKFSLRVAIKSYASGHADLRLSSGVYSHPHLQQDRPDSVTRINRFPVSLPTPPVRSASRIPPPIVHLALDTEQPLQFLSVRDDPSWTSTLSRASWVSRALVVHPQDGVENYDAYYNKDNPIKSDTADERHETARINECQSPSSSHLQEQGVFLEQQEQQQQLLDTFRNDDIRQEIIRTFLLKK